MIIGNADLIFLHGDSLASQQAFVTFYLCCGSLVSGFVGGVLQGNVTRINGGDQLSFLYPLTFYHRQIYDLSADTEGQFHVFYGFYNTGEVFPDDRLGAGSSCLDRSDQRGIALFLVPA